MQREDDAHAHGEDEEQDQLAEGGFLPDLPEKLKGAALRGVEVCLLFAWLREIVFINETGGDAAQQHHQRAEVNDPEAAVHGPEVFPEKFDQEDIRDDGGNVHQQIIDIEPRGTRIQRGKAPDGSLNDGRHERRAERHDQDARHDGQASALHRGADIRAQPHDEASGDEDDEADQVGAPDADDVTDGTHCKHECGNEQGVQSHPQGRVRIVEAAIIRQVKDEHRDHGEIGHAVKKLDDVREPEIFGNGF